MDNQLLAHNQLLQEKSEEGLLARERAKRKPERACKLQQHLVYVS